MVIRSLLLLSLASIASIASFACGGAQPEHAKTAAGETSSHRAIEANHVTGTKAKALVANGAKLVDVRTPDEYAAKHIEGAESAPVETIGAKDLGPKETPLIVYCHSGKRSAKAAEVLRSRGYTQVYELGAMTNWDEN